MHVQRDRNESADAVVIGGGIVGSATAYYLAKRGAKVVLLEKGSIGNEQSNRAWGFVRQQGRDPAELPLMVESNKIWPGLSEELGVDIEWVQGGNLRVAKTEKQLAQFEDWVNSVRDFNLGTKMLTAAEVAELVPDMTGTWAGGMYTASDGHAEPTKVAPAFARAAEKLGAQVRTFCPAHGIELTTGRVSGVITGDGIIRTPVVVCAAGAWSTQIARTVGLSLPQVAVLSTAAETEPVRPITKVAAWTPGCAFRQRPDGRFYVAGGGRSRVDITLDSVRYARYFLPNYLKNRRIFQMRPGVRLLRDLWQTLPIPGDQTPPFAVAGDVEPTPDAKLAEQTRQNFMKLFPSVGPVRLRRVWAGWIDSLPDAVPVLGEADHVEGFIFATGFSGHGFAMGPIVGRVLSELILDGQPSVDISNLSYSRFRDGKIGKPRNVI